MKKHQVCVKSSVYFCCISVTCMCNIGIGGVSIHTAAYLGDGATAPLWSDCEFFDNFCTVFANFISRLNRKIRVPRFPATVGVFCQSKTASKCTLTSFWERKRFFFWREAQPPKPHPSPSTPRPLLTEINTPLHPSVTCRYWIKTYDHAVFTI